MYRVWIVRVKQSLKMHALSRASVWFLYSRLLTLLNRTCSLCGYERLILT